jgi:hypothetical protein
MVGRLGRSSVGKGIIRLDMTPDYNLYNRMPEKSLLDSKKWKSLILCVFKPCARADKSPGSM